ncbi:hypothetical protein [Nostoc sp. CCY 9925]|uniref:hypothetical protein n=1 Tax=Nostoc sp. CCY 9925 TaxID=3103865 RepID=UPI0039C60C88
MLSFPVATGSINQKKFSLQLSTSVGCILLLLTTACSQGKSESAQSVEAINANSINSIAASNNISSLRIGSEAIAELEYAVNVLGFKAIQIPGHIRRPIPAFEKYGQEVANEAIWIDTFGLDSKYDYDPFWAKCVELKVVPTNHSSGMGWINRRSIRNKKSSPKKTSATSYQSTHWSCTPASIVTFSRVQVLRKPQMNFWLRSRSRDWGVREMKKPVITNAQCPIPFFKVFHVPFPLFSRRVSFAHSTFLLNSLFNSKLGKYLEQQC